MPYFRYTLHSFGNLFVPSLAFTIIFENLYEKVLDRSTSLPLYANFSLCSLHCTNVVDFMSIFRKKTLVESLKKLMTDSLEIRIHVIPARCKLIDPKWFFNILNEA